MLSETEIMELEQGIANVLRIATPVEEGSDDEARIAAVRDEILAEEPNTLQEAFTILVDLDDTEVTRLVSSYYQVFLGRQPDPAGLTFWVQRVEEAATELLAEQGIDIGDATEQQIENAIRVVTANTDDPNSLANVFASFGTVEEPSEFATIYGGLSVEGVVREFYRNNLGRDPLVPDEDGLTDVAGFTFWVNATNQRIDEGVEAGMSEEDAFQEAISQLAVDFVFANETQDTVFGPLLDSLLINLANEGDSALDPDGSLFDVTGDFIPVATQLDAVTTLLQLNTAPGATPDSIGGLDDDGKFVVAGGSDIDALRLAGDASVRIDFTDPREQLEGIDIDGSKDGVLGADEVFDGITFDEQDADFRRIFDVSNFDIIDAHPRGDALLNPGLTDGDPANIGFSGNLYFDGTGFDGTGTNLNGNIVLGGYGADVIFTGNGNDFISSGGLDDNIKAGRNADFIYQELSRLDDPFSGDDGEIDGGATFDDDPAADSDWLLLEASDDEEPVVVSLSEDSNDLGFDVNAGDTLVDIDDFLAQLIADEDIGVISTRFGNDAARIQNIENVNASGNFYKFLDTAVSADFSTAYAAAGNFTNFDEQAPLILRIVFDGEIDGEPFEFAIEPADLAGVTDMTSLRVAVQAAFDADPRFAGNVTVPLDSNPVEGFNFPDDFLNLDADGNLLGADGSIVEAGSEGDVGPVDPDDTTQGRFGPVALAISREGSGIDFNGIPGVAVDEAEDVRSLTRDFTTIENLIPDLFFGDNRDFSPEEAEFRVPALSPGVTAQLILFGTEAEDGFEGLGEEDRGDDGLGDIPIGSIAEDGGNILIAGYDNDYVAGIGGDDLLMGGDLEFLLTHRHNPNLFNTATGGISVNAADGIADDGRDTLIGGDGSDDLVFEADGGIYAGDNDGSAGLDERVSSDDNEGAGTDTLWFTLFSVGRLAGTVRATDGSRQDFLALALEDSNFNEDGTIDPESDLAVATQDLTGINVDEVNAELDAVNLMVEDLVFRFDLGVGAGFDYQGGDDDPFVGDLQGADRAGTADQTNYRSGFSASTIVDIEDFNASGLNLRPDAGLDYLAAGVEGDAGTDLTFENRQNYRGTNARVDIRGIDEFSAIEASVENGSGTDDAILITTGTDQDFTTDRLAADFNVSFVDAEGGAIADLVYAKSEDFSDGTPPSVLNTGVGSDIAENRLFTNRGNDVLEGRGGDDWLEGREGDDIFIVALNETASSQDVSDAFGDIQQGDNVNIIARRLDLQTIDDETGILTPGGDGLVDEPVSGAAAVGRDFRNDLADAPPITITTRTFQLQPAEDIDVPGGRDDWSTVSEILFIFAGQPPVVVDFEGQNITDAEEAAALIALELDSRFSVFANRTVVNDPDTDEDDIDIDPTDPNAGLVFPPISAADPQVEHVDAVYIQFNLAEVNDFIDPVVTFRSDAGDVGNSSFGIEAFQDTVVVPAPDVVEDDQVVFRSYQNRFDDESIPDRQASLGLEAYAEDLVVGVEDGTTKLVEGQEYRIFFDDLKENDTVSLTLNGMTYTRTVDFAGTEATAESETTEAFLQAFADEINHKISKDPHSRDGHIEVLFDNAPFGSGSPNDDDQNDGALIIRERAVADDSAEHVYIRFPQVSIQNNSGGDAPTWVVKETSDTSVVLFDYDYRDAETDGLNRGVDRLDQRNQPGESFDDRFITFEDTTALNRAILQDNPDAGGLLEGLDITVFNNPGAPGFRDANDFFENAVEVDLRAQITTDPNDAFLPENDFEQVTGNEFDRGQPTSGSFSGLNGDDNLRGGTGIDTILGYTGDDRVIASTNSNSLFLETYNGGVNVVVDDETGAIQEEGTLDPIDDRPSGLDQTAGEDETLLQFFDALILKQGAASEALETERAPFNSTADFLVTVTGIAEDFSADGTVGVDENDDEIFTEHTMTFLNFEVVRTLNDQADDELVFGGAITSVNYNNGETESAVSGDGDTIFTTGSGDDEVEGGAQFQGFERVTGSAGDDTLTGGKQNETLIGGAGDDMIDGGIGSDSLSGGSGDDAIIDTGIEEDTSGEFTKEFDADDTIDGGTGDDTLADGEGDDVVSGGLGEDLIILGSGADTVDAGDGTDTILNTFDGDADVIEVGLGLDYVHLFDPNDGDFVEGETIDFTGFDGLFNAGSGLDSALDDAEVITDALGGNVVSITDLSGEGGVPEAFTGGVVIQFFGDTPDSSPDEDGDDEDEAFEITFVSADGTTTTETIAVGVDADATEAPELAVAVHDALETRGYTVAYDGTAGVTDAIIVTADPEGNGVAVQNIESVNADVDGDAETGLGAAADQGFGVTMDLRNASISASRFNLNGGTAILSSNTFAFGSVVFASDFEALSQIIFASSDGGEPVTNQLSNSNLDGGAQTLRSGVIIIGDILGTEEVDDTLTGNSDGWNETFIGGLGDDTIDGGDGDDTIFGFGSDDDLEDGQSDDDSIAGGSGDDCIKAGSGDDSVEGGAGQDGIEGGDGDDTLDGGAGGDVIFGGSGDDLITVGAAEIATFDEDDLVFLEEDESGEDIDDVLAEDGNVFSVFLKAGSWVNVDIDNGFDGGDDSSFDSQVTVEGPGGSGSDDLTVGGSATDSVTFEGDPDELDPSDAAPEDPFGFFIANVDGVYTFTVEAQDPGFTFSATAADSYEITDQSGTVLVGTGSGVDDINLDPEMGPVVPSLIDPNADGLTDDALVGAGADAILGTADDVWAAAGFTVAPGTIAGVDTDTLTGGNQFDLTVESNFDPLFDDGLFRESWTFDLILSGNTAFGEAGDDTITGGGGFDSLVGGAGADSISGGGSFDVLQGGAGGDVILGEGGDDRIQGDAGADTLTGGAGDNVFVYNPNGTFDNDDSRPTEGGIDTITDFEAGDDFLDISAFAGTNGLPATRPLDVAFVETDLSEDVENDFGLTGDDAEPFDVLIVQDGEEALVILDIGDIDDVFDQQDLAIRLQNGDSGDFNLNPAGDDGFIFNVLDGTTYNLLDSNLEEIDLFGADGMAGTSDDLVDPGVDATFGTNDDTALNLPGIADGTFAAGTDPMMTGTANAMFDLDEDGVPTAVNGFAPLNDDNGPDIFIYPEMPDILIA